MTEPLRPKAFAAAEAVAARRALLGQRHLRPFEPYLVRLRAEFGAVPDPDPLDGGASARLLLLLETPGPSIGRSGLVSRDNPTGTAANLFGFLNEAGIDRRDTLIWNAVPWVIHAPGATNRAPRPAEIRAGLASLPDLLALLPRLSVVVLSGRVAGLASPIFAENRPDLPVLTMPHPSPTYLCTSPAHPARCRAVLEAAALLLNRVKLDHDALHPLPCGEGRADAKRSAEVEVGTSETGLSSHTPSDPHPALRSAPATLPSGHGRRRGRAHDQRSAN